MSIAATERMFGRSHDAGRAGNVSASLSMPSLPAETTKSIPEFAIAAFSSGALVSRPRPLHELLAIRTPNDFA